MDFKMWLEDCESRGYNCTMRKAAINQVYSLTTGKESAKWTYIKNPASEYREYYVFDGKRLYKIIFDNKDGRQIESWNINGVNKITYRICSSKGEEVRSIDLHIGEDPISFSSAEDVPSKDIIAFERWAPIYNELIEAFYKMLIEQI